MDSIKHLKIFCFIVTHFITNLFVPNRKASLKSIYKNYIHLYILHTVNEFKEKWAEKHNIYERLCHCTWFIIMVLSVTESLL